MNDSILDKLDAIEIAPERGKHISTGPTVSILKDGFIGLNRATFEGMGNPEALVLLKAQYGDSAYMILRPAKKTERNAITFTRPQGGRYRINARNSLRYFDHVDRNESYRYPVVELGSDGRAVIELTGDKEKVSRNR